MSYKRNNFESNGQEDNGKDSRRKKMHNECLRNDPEKRHNQNSESFQIIPNITGTNERNNKEKLAKITNLPLQSSPETCQNRKRRPRAFQEKTELEASTERVSLPSSTTNSQSRKRSDLSCVVCCGVAHGYNFDAISCESCKAFFRRNALFNSDRLKCRRDNACDITPETRRRCKSCRLKKCFAVGMRKEWILTEEEKINKKRRIEENRRLRLSTINETSPTSEPTIQAKDNDFDFQSIVLERNHLTSSSSSLPTTDTNSSAQNSDVISRVVVAFNEGFQLDPISYGWSYPLTKKITALCQILNTKTTTALRLISFFKRLTEFDTLNETDKLNLIKNNLPYIFFYQASLGYDPINDIYHEGIPTKDTLLYGSEIRQAHGDDIYFRCVLIMRSLHSIIKIDKRIIQMTLVIMLFSKGLSSIINFREPLLNNPKEVLGAQNYYAEQLWLFIDRHYGTAQAVVIFSTIISKCLLIQMLLRDIQQDIHDKIDPCQMPPIMRTIMHLS